VPNPDGSTEPPYRSSSFSNQVNCLEIGWESHGRTVRLRDSKDRTRTPLMLSAERWRAFVTSLRAGEFDRH
jgi:Domain of unknown function (DUF397)